jgi:hypothetical protein
VWTVQQEAELFEFSDVASLGDDSGSVTNFFPRGMFALLDDLDEGPEEELLPAGKLRNSPLDVLAGRDPFSMVLVVLYRSLKGFFTTPTLLFCSGGAAVVAAAPIAPPAAPSRVPTCYDICSGTIVT